jgi:2-C-methyl-D-erythritol 2,4-cyclodiphosphate synthase
MRVGLGMVQYPLDPSRVLMLGGIKIQGSWGLRGPADGDAALHAVIEALLGAAALGDREDHFPQDDASTIGAPSAIQVAETLALLGEAGLRPAHVDVTLVAERTALREERGAMRERLASLLRLEPGQVSVNASAAGGLGALGRAEGIAAFAVASLEEKPA